MPWELFNLAGTVSGVGCVRAVRGGRGKTFFLISKDFTVDLSGGGQVVTLLILDGLDGVGCDGGKYGLVYPFWVFSESVIVFLKEDFVVSEVLFANYFSCRGFGLFTNVAKLFNPFSCKRQGNRLESVKGVLFEGFCKM